MTITKLGCYKVRRLQGCTYFRVYSDRGKLKYFENNGPRCDYVREDHSDLNVVKEMHAPVEAKRIKVTISFDDQDGDEIEMTARSQYALKAIFKRFPCIGKGL